jgi:hypothetical protein
MFAQNQQVQHPRFGTGTVLFDQGATVVVSLRDRLAACLATDLARRFMVGEALAAGQWSPSLPVRLKGQAAVSCASAWPGFVARWRSGRSGLRPAHANTPSAAARRVLSGL